MSKPFMDALKGYFKAKYERDDLEIEIEYDEGYAYSSYTYENAAFKVTIRGGDRYWIEQHSDQDAADFLNKLLDWEDAQEPPTS